MFTWLNKQAVRSSEGYEVHFLSRGTAQYREGLRVRTVPVEDGLVAGRPAVLFDRRVFEHWDNSSIANSASEQQRLLSNFVSALRFQGLETEY
jgi:hypothetical protein